jgi:hypothetical protein
VACPAVTQTRSRRGSSFELAASYLDALTRAAREFVVTGLKVIQKCAAVRSYAEKADLALEAGQRVHCLPTQRTPPRG